MANIKVDLTEPLVNGMDITFKAPCACSDVTGMIVYYPLDDGTGTGSQTFTFKDAHNNALTGLGNLFSQGVLVKVIVDVDTSAAYIQNADTNKYLEDKIENAGTDITLSSSVTSTSTTTAANSYAVKRAYDLAANANSQLNFRTGTGVVSAEFDISNSECAYYVRAGICYCSIHVEGTSSNTLSSITVYSVTGLPTPITGAYGFALLHGVARQVRKSVERACFLYAWYNDGVLTLNAKREIDSAVDYGNQVYDTLAFSYVVA